MSTAQREIAALQQALAGVHAAVWGYGVLGPHLGTDETRGTSTYHLYRRLRDKLIARLRERSAPPVAADPGYALPFRVTDATSARRLAVHLENGCAAVFADLVSGAESDEIRRLGSEILRDCADRRLGWGAEPVAFPGLPERR
jgi:hypothetical protein